MNDTINLLEIDDYPESSKLEQLRLNGDEAAVIFFTPEATKVKLHYCSETELTGYVHCNDEGCVLCRIGRKIDERYLLPVYSLFNKTVSVLAVSPDVRPHTLLPQIRPLLSLKNQIVFISKPDKVIFKVTHRELSPDVEINEAMIEKFSNAEDYSEQIKSIFPRYSNSILTDIESINFKLRLKGVTI
jgi:hypothetical protein